jgi:heat shock protein HtpX
MIKRIFLFVLTNILVMATISIVISVLGIQPYLSASGIDYQSLMAFCAVWGMGGSFISLLMSKTMAKWMMGVSIIDPNTTDPNGRDLVALVHRLAMGAKLPAMPEVGVYDSPEVNAFATGPSRGNALVAVSTGLLNQMGRRELEGVLGHEISHVANGDMVTMTLIQGVVNAFVMFFARIAAYAVSNLMRSEDDDRRPSYMVQHLLVFVFDILFGILGSIVVCAFSRHREFRADKGGATLAGREKMIGALQALQRTSEMVDTRQAAFQSLKIAGAPKGIVGLLMTHPPLEVRIERLRLMQG